MKRDHWRGVVASVGGAVVLLHGIRWLLSGIAAPLLGTKWEGMGIGGYPSTSGHSFIMRNVGVGANVKGDQYATGW